jgi:hypothetical protein
MQTLRVYPNPWLARDRDGVPCAVVPTDPEYDGGGPGRFVGARLDHNATQVLQDFGEMGKHELRSPMQRTRYLYQGIASSDPQLARLLFATEPVALPVTRYYKLRLREGALLPADAETAALGKVRFVPAGELAKRYAIRVAPVALNGDGGGSREPSAPLELKGTLEHGGAPLSLGEKVGDFLPPQPGDQPLPSAPAPAKAKGSKSKTDTERA